MRQRRRLDARAHDGITESEEARLLASIAGGDRRAFELLYRSYFPRLTRFLGRMTRSVELIEEVVNDTMLVVWQKAASYDGSCKVSTWVFAIAYRKALKGLKQRDEPVEADDEHYPAGSGAEPEYRLGRQQLRQSVVEALDLLPLAQRMVMVLTYYHDMAYAEIADIVDCPVNTVKTRMFHARHRLQGLLASEKEGSK
ncbi:sigma-70 family RNA polymerase sigma factor [Rugamonas sp.]|uniref:RNA polymerase sigma factor n=1 Tax=Rugamonas sp. TaxID=1926287 RepID=UPI0025FA0BF9|nr:sigma-70 family RNA polymerase sigma factor [Rugamonas sp.]